MSAPERASPQLRLTILLVVVASLFVALFARLWFLQVIERPQRPGGGRRTTAIRLVYTAAPRGIILDRNGNVLVGNVNEPVIEVSQLVAKQQPSMVTRLAPLLGMTVQQLKTAINNPQYSPYAPVPVLADATPQQILYVRGEPAAVPRRAGHHRVGADLHRHGQGGCQHRRLRRPDLASPSTAA